MTALAGVELVEASSHALGKGGGGVMGSIPGQNMYLGFVFNPQLGCVWEIANGCTSHTHVSLSPFLPPSLKSILKRKRKKLFNWDKRICHFQEWVFRSSALQCIQYHLRN